MGWALWTMVCSSASPMCVCLCLPQGGFDRVGPCMVSGALVGGSGWAPAFHKFHALQRCGPWTLRAAPRGLGDKGEVRGRPSIAHSPLAPAGPSRTQLSWKAARPLAHEGEEMKEESGREESRKTENRVRRKNKIHFEINKTSKQKLYDNAKGNNKDAYRRH